MRAGFWLLLLRMNYRKTCIIKQQSFYVAHEFLVRNLGRAGLGSSHLGFLMPLESDVSWTVVI